MNISGCPPKNYTRLTLPMTNGHNHNTYRVECNIPYMHTHTHTHTRPTKIITVLVSFNIISRIVTSTVYILHIFFTIIIIHFIPRYQSARARVGHYHIIIIIYYYNLTLCSIYIIIAKFTMCDNRQLYK